MSDEIEKARRLAANDPRLRDLIVAGSETERRKAIDELVAEVRPIITSVAMRHRSSTLRSADLEDITATAMLRLVRRLQFVPSSDENAILSLHDFAARLTYNAAYEVLRQRFPQRTRLKNRLRYALTREARFATWVVEGEVVAGLSAWRGRTDVAPGLFSTADVGTPMFSQNQTAEAIDAILRRAGRPMPLNDLTGVCAELWGISDEPGGVPPEAQTATTPLDELQTKQHLRILWGEIETLPPPQRAALLLNLRDVDGLNAVALFVLLGIATVGQVAGVLEMTADELAEIWHDLPLDDLTIGSMLGRTRQQVINLRKSARERLGRRMRK